MSVNQVLIVLVFIVIFFISLGAGYYLGRLGKKDSFPENRDRDLISPQSRPSGKGHLDSRATKIMPDSASGNRKSKEIINSLFSTVVELKGRDVNEIYSILASFITNNTCADFSAIFAKQDTDYIMRGSSGLSAHAQDKIKFSQNDSFIRWVAEKNVPIFLSEKRGDIQIKNFKHLDENIDELMLFPLCPRKELLGILLAMTKKKGGEFSEIDETLLSIMSGIYAFYIHNMNLDKELEQIYINTTIAIATFLEKRDKYTQGHSERVKELSVRLAKKMKLDKKDKKYMRKLSLSASLHDIGKIGIPDAVLNKPGKLTDEEFNKIKEHPEIGATMLEPLSFLRDCIPGILYHHEKYDGTGYPNKLKGDKIPLEAKIISVADVYDALTTDRPYRAGFKHEVAVDMMWEMNKKNFDPEILGEFISMYSEKEKPVLAGVDSEDDF